MATTIVPGPGVYLEDFENGQGVGAPNYFVYAQDMDINFVTLRQTVNQLVGEVRAIQGPNAALAADVEAINDPLSGDFSLDGRIGNHSYLTTINGGDTTQLDLTAGQFLLNGLKVDAASPFVIQGSGGAGTRWVALDINGVPSLELLAAQQAVDIASVNWDGAQFTGAITELVPIFFDGDEWADFKARPASAPSFTAKDFRQGGDRVLAIERLLSGQSTDGDGDPVGPLSVLFGDGTVGAPSVSFVNETNTGLRRPGAGGISVVVGGVDAILIASDRFVDLPTQAMAVATGAHTTTAVSTWESVPFTAVQQQVGALINTGGANPERITVPTGGDGDYRVDVNVRWDETTGTGTGVARSARVVKNLGGAAVTLWDTNSTPNGGTAIPTGVCIALEAPGLVATDHLTVQILQDDVIGLAATSHVSARKTA